MVSDTEPWEYEASCRGLDDLMWGIFHDHEYFNELKVNYCRDCLVREECLQAGLDLEERMRYRNGIWGGMTPSERDRRYGMLRGD